MPTKCLRYCLLATKTYNRTDPNKRAGWKFQSIFMEGKDKLLFKYSSSPNNRADPNKRAWRKFQSLLMEVKGQIDTYCCS